MSSDEVLENVSLTILSEVEAEKVLDLYSLDHKPFIILE